MSGTDAKRKAIESVGEEKFSSLWKKLNPPVQVHTHRTDNKDDHRRFNVFRDDALVGGTKQRAMLLMLLAHPAEEFVYAGPATGFAQIALSYSAMLCRKRVCRKRATVVLAKRRNYHPYTYFAKRECGGKVVEVYGTKKIQDLKDKGEEYVRDQLERGCNTVLCPFGLECNLFVDGLAMALKESLPRELLEPGKHPKTLWLVAGSATILKVLHSIWPHTFFNIVQVGKKIWPDQHEHMKSKLHRSTLRFSQEASVKPPYPSPITYDAKLWEFVIRHGEDGDYIWNVADEKTFDSRLTPHERQ